MTHTRLLFVFPFAMAALSLLPLASVAYAAEPTAADKESARDLMDRGDKFSEAKDYQNALKSYQAAHALMEVPTTGIEVAKTYTALHQLIEAREMALNVARMPTKAGEPVPFAQARRDAQELADALAPRIPSVQITVEGLPDGTDAEVRVDEELLPTAVAKLPRKVNPGRHVVVASAAGYPDAKAAVVVKEGQVRPLTLSFEPPDPSAVKSAISPGKVLTYGGFGLAGVGLVVGSIAGIVSLANASAAKSQCNGIVCPPAAQSDIDTSRSAGVVSNVFFGLGLVGAGVGVIALLVSGNHGSTPKASNGLRMIPTVGFGSFKLEGQF